MFAVRATKTKVYNISVRNDEIANGSGSVNINVYDITSSYASETVVSNLNKTNQSTYEGVISYGYNYVKPSQ